jgi:FtsH-binding integral membrane protein
MLFSQEIVYPTCTGGVSMQGGTAPTGLKALKEGLFIGFILALAYVIVAIAILINFFIGESDFKDSDIDFELPKAL